jgi:RNA polymerase sigma-70 factor, ECF subfamily
MMKSVEERAIGLRAKKNAVGFGELFDAYYDRIYAYAYRRVGLRDEAEDIAASVFEDALVGIKRWRWQGKPIVAWLYRIASRRVADYYRTHDADPFFSEVVSLVENHIDDEMDRKDEYAAVQRGLDKLSAHDREIIQLAFFDELGGAEIAAILGCATGSVYVRLHRALKRLHAVLGPDLRGAL